jgi:hypothetical protein
MMRMAAFIVANIAAQCKEATQRARCSSPFALRALPFALCADILPSLFTAPNYKPNPGGASLLEQRLAHGQRNTER